MDQNPVRAGLVGSAAQYPWSSAQAHLEGQDPIGLVDLALWREVRFQGDWAETLQRPAPPERDQRLRQATHSGLPLGNDDFVAGLAHEFGRRLTRGHAGRPRQMRAATA